MQTEKEKSHSKVKLGFGLVLILLIILFATNLIIGKILEEKLAQNIEQNLTEMEQPLDFTYENLKVNPILAQASFKNGVIKGSDDQASMNIKWEEAVYKGGYADLFNLISEEASQINELHTLETDFDNLEISGKIKAGESFDYLFSFAELGLDFKGNLSREELNNNPEQFLTHNQNLKFSFADFKMDFPTLFDKILINSNLKEKLLKLNKVDLTLDYSAADKNIKIKEIVNSSYSSGELTGDIKLIGENVKNIKGIDLDLESKGEFDISNLKWGKANQTGKYTINKMYGSSEFEIDRKIDFANYVAEESTILGESNYDFNLEGLKVQIAGGLKEKLSANPMVMMSGINISEIMINNLNLLYQTNNEELRIKKGKLDSSIVDADIVADLKLNNQYPGLSKINNLKVKLSDFKGDLRMLFEGMESRMGISLPREGDSVVLEMKGSFDQPRIKGVHY